MVTFHVSGVETYWWLPVVVAAAISSVTSVGGLSGAFLMLPFQMTVLGFVSPAVSPTNLLFNVVAIPSGVISYMREGRMVWPVTWAVALGTLPGVMLGVFIRVLILPKPQSFKLFVAAVLAYVCYRLIKEVLNRREPEVRLEGNFKVTGERFGWRKVEFDFEGQHYCAPTLAVFLLALIVGLIGGTYGIGGGAIMVPFLVTVFGFPVHTIAGAALMGSFLTSVLGVVFFTLVEPMVAGVAVSAHPDWALGLLFGLGGSIGMFIGAHIQRYLPPRLIKLLLIVLLAVVVIKYVTEAL